MSDFTDLIPPSLHDAHDRLRQPRGEYENLYLIAAILQSIRRENAAYTPTFPAEIAAADQLEAAVQTWADRLQLDAYLTDRDQQLVLKLKDAGQR
jgi:hypothetical protein